MREREGRRSEIRRKKNEGEKTRKNTAREEEKRKEEEGSGEIPYCSFLPLSLPLRATILIPGAVFGPICIFSPNGQRVIIHSDAARL